MLSLGDLLLLISVMIALFIVPPYLWRVYGGAATVKRFMSSLSGAVERYAGSSTGAASPVLPRQHQAAPELLPDFAGVLDFLRRHNLTDDQAIDLLTLAHRESGDLLSANKIRDIVGGNEAEVKRRVASHRPKPPQPRSQGRLVRPDGGW